MKRLPRSVSSDHNLVLSARRSVCVNGRHRGEPVHLFSQSLTGGERTPGCLSDLSGGGDRGREPSVRTLGGMTFDPWGVSSQLGNRHAHTRSVPLSCGFCPFKDSTQRSLNVARNTMSIGLVLHVWRSEETHSLRDRAVFWKCWTGCYCAAVSDNPPDISFSHSKMKTKGGI